MKTPMQELEQTAKGMSKLSGDSGFVGRSILAIIENEKLIEKEKQHIIDAFDSGYKSATIFFDTGGYAIIEQIKGEDSEQYYNETFNK